MKSLVNEGTKKEISQLRKELYTIKKERENSTIETIYDKNGNTVSMHETVKEVDEYTVTKGNIKPLKSYHSTSLQSDHVEDIGENNNFLMIEAF